jgi:hypothetical protein
MRFYMHNIYYDGGNDMASFLRARYYDRCSDTTTILLKPNAGVDVVQMPAVLCAAGGVQNYRYSLSFEYGWI